MKPVTNHVWDRVSGRVRVRVWGRVSVRVGVSIWRAL